MSNITMSNIIDAVLADLINELPGMKVQSGVRAGVDASYGRVKPIPAVIKPIFFPIIK